MVRRSKLRSSGNGRALRTSGAWSQPRRALASLGQRFWKSRTRWASELMAHQGRPLAARSGVLGSWGFCKAAIVVMVPIDTDQRPAPTRRYLGMKHNPHIDPNNGVGHLHAAEVKRFLRKSAVYLFHPRRIAAVAHHPFRRPGSPFATGATVAQRVPGRRLPTAT